MRTETWYLAWPDRVEPILWEDYITAHREDAGQFHGSRGPFPTSEEAEDWRSNDMLERYWQNPGMAVYAQHCTSCGRFAKVLAFDHDPNFSFVVTECKRCGIKDSRDGKAKD